MSTTADLTHAPDPISDLYDPDEVVPRNSPLLEPRRPKLQLTPSPPPPFPQQEAGCPSRPGIKPNRRMKTQPSQGDAVLVAFLDGGRRPEIASHAAKEALPSDSDEDDLISDEFSSSSGSAKSRLAGEADEEGQKESEAATAGGAREGQTERPGNSSDVGKEMDMGGFDLKTLAAGALAFAITEPRQEPINAGPTPPTTEHDVVRERPQGGTIPPAIATRRDGPAQDERTVPGAAPSPYTPHSLFSPREQSHILAPPKMSPTNGLSPKGLGEGLPPIQMNSPRSDTNGNTPLPSIRAQLGDLKTLEHNHVAEKYERNARHTAFSHSPPNLPRLPSMHAPHASPPVSPNETFRRDLPSPAHGLPMVTSPGFFYGHTNGVPRSAETPNSEQSGSTPSTSLTDRVSLDGLTHPPGAYVCKFAGCSAQPFQTQYLLNSHANVHSSIRPHYCPVSGCPRSEGGKGFKRKNEMIRHGLVHDSPGYVCPFCPDREHKYPRPDNLQRHVRVHHVDKDKDDPLLRDVLAQRPDGPNRGRRRRAVAN